MDWTARKKYLVPETKEERRRCVVLSCVKKPRHKILSPIPISVNVKKIGEGKGFCLTFFPFPVILHTSSECAGRQSTPISGTISSGHYPHHMCMCLNNVSKHFPNTKYAICIYLNNLADFSRMDTSHPSPALFAEYSPPSVIIGHRLWKLQLVIFQNIIFLNLQKKSKMFIFS